MKPLHAELSASITELKKNPSALISQADGNTVVILNHNKPAAYLLSAEVYETLLVRLEDLELASLVHERQAEKAQAIEVSFEDL